MKRLSFALALVLLLATASFGLEFSADTYTTARDMQMTGKIYFKDKKIRMERSSPRNSITIVRVDRNVVWTIMPDQKKYMEMAFDVSQKPRVEEKIDGELDRKFLGTETIDGRSTKKYLVTYKSGGSESQMYQWIATEIRFPVKSASVDGSWSQEYRNIKMGSPADSLFEVPAGYQKVQLPTFPMPKGK